MAKRAKNRFAGRTARSMERPRSMYSYLKVPDDINVFKPEGGVDVIFDIIPYIVTDPEHVDNKKYDDDAVKGEMWWKRPIRVHRDVGPDSIQIICPTTVGKKCPICEYGARQKKAGVEWEKISEFFPKNRTIFYVVPVDTQEYETDYPEGVVHILDVSDHNFTKYLKEEADRDIDNQGFPDPEDGMSLECFFRTKKFHDSTFEELAKVSFVERSEQYDVAFVEELPSLDDLLIIKDYKEIEAMYFGMEGLDDEDIEDTELEDEPPKRQRKTARPATSTRKPRKDPEPEEEEKPKRTRARKPKEETSEEEKPRRTRKPKEDKEKCPYDHKFGVDFDSYSDCDDCTIWKQCEDELKKNNEEE